MEVVRTGLVFLGLFCNSIKDLRKKEISLGVTICFGVVGLILRYVEHGQIEDLLCSLLPGFIFLFLAFATRQQIGYGDAWVLLATGCCLTYKEIVLACMLSVVTIAMVALFLCAFLRKNRRYELPFVPFLFAGVICVRCLCL